MAHDLPATATQTGSRADELAEVLGAAAEHRDSDLDDPTWEALASHLDEAGTVELCLLVGHDEMLATVITTLRIRPGPRRR